MKVFCSKKFKAFLQKEKCFLVDLEWVFPRGLTIQEADHYWHNRMRL